MITPPVLIVPLVVLEVVDMILDITLFNKFNCNIDYVSFCSM